VLPIVGIPLAIKRYCSHFDGVFKYQRQVENFATVITGLIASDNKTIAGIHQLFAFGSGYDSLHNFMTISPWSVDELRKHRLEYVKNQLSKDVKRLSNKQQSPIKITDTVNRQSSKGMIATVNQHSSEQLPTKAIDNNYPRAIAIDASFTHHTGEHIYGVYWYWDYAKKAFVLAQRLVLSTLVTAEKQVALGWKLYHRGFLDEQKLYLEAVKPEPKADATAWDEYNGLVEKYEENKKEHKKQWLLAKELVDECEKLGIEKDAYVCDAGLVVPELMDHIESLGRAWVSKMAKSRLVQTNKGAFEPVEAFAKSVPKDAFKPVQVRTRHGEQRTYYCFSKCVVVYEWEKIRLVISYDNEKLEGEPVYLITNKKNWVQPQKIVQLYTMRDPVEHFIRDGKQEVGLEDSQQRTEDGVRKHWELSLVAHTFLELGFDVPALPEVPTVRLETIGQKSRLIKGAILQGFVNLVKQWVLDDMDTKELVHQIMTKRLNRLAA
jgi:Transposase DDE domain